MAVRSKLTSARLLAPDLAWTFRIESVPLFVDVLPESIQASALAESVIGEQAATASTVQA
jgi:hypothetical protein